jgi:predicted dehydrogenase
MHSENARPFLAAKVPVLCEKPLAATLDQARELADAVRRSGTLFMSAFCHRFHGPILELRELICAGRLGEPVYFRNIFGGFAEFRGNHRINPSLSGGGCVMDNGAHSVDLFRFLVGEPTRVQAMTGNVLQDIPVEDFGFLHLSLNERVFGEITLSYSLKGCGNWLEGYGSKGRATISYWNPGVPELTVLGDGDKEPVTVDCSKHPDRITAEIAHFVECVRTGQPPRITVEDGLRANQIIAAAYDSARSGWSVKLPPA